MKNLRIFLFLSIPVLMLIVPVYFLAQWKGEPGPIPRTPSKELTGNVTPKFVGSKACSECHSEEVSAWSPSHHSLAMQHADTETVLGNFDNTTFEYFGETTRFYRRGIQFWVNTPGPDGSAQDFQVKYTFGVHPLQQYLVEFPDGRLQALAYAWDNRSIEEGGQRWYHLYPDEYIKHNDSLHWTRMNQNWNHMCAECHSTNLKKNFDLAQNRFNTTWSEINVACEACHGPASRHLAWVDAFLSGSEVPESSFAGFDFTLSDTSGGEWVMDESVGTAKRSAPPSSIILEETCARCHSRRSVLDEYYVHGNPLLDTHRLSLIENILYHPDGQILDEVYEYGSFLQSKMHHAGVNCNDCHDPHSLRLKLPGDMLCTQCHLPAKFATPEHHHHAADSPGASCIACHMPTKTYMGVDVRHDHSFRVPRPDLSVKFGVPNACTQCHEGLDNELAQLQVEAWYGIKERPQDFTHIFDAAWKGDPRVTPQLAEIAADSVHRDIIRASALALLHGKYTQETMPVLLDALGHANPMMRLAAVEALGSLPLQERFGVLYPLLEDDVLAVRATSARLLSEVPLSSLPDKEAKLLSAALKVYLETEATNAERAATHLNLGLYHLSQGDAKAAEEAYKNAIKLEDDFLQSYVNLADLYRTLSRDAEGVVLLENALEKFPGQPLLHHALALALTRTAKTDVAMPHFADAATLGADDPTFPYVNAIALHSTGKSDEALTALQNNLGRNPFHYESHLAIITLNRDMGNLDAAKAALLRMKEYWPSDPAVVELEAVLKP